MNIGRPRERVKGGPNEVSSKDRLDELERTLPSSESIRALQADARKRGLDRMNLQEINAEISATREERKRRSA